MALEISVKGKYLGPVASFLSELTLAGRPSRTRSRLIRELQKSREQFSQALVDLAGTLGGTINPNGTINFEDPNNTPKFVEQRAELDDEEYIYSENIKGEFLVLYNALNDVTVDGRFADAYDALMGAFEEAFQTADDAEK